jgi:hypothetical protein
MFATFIGDHGMIAWNKIPERGLPITANKEPHLEHLVLIVNQGQRVVVGIYPCKGAARWLFQKSLRT